MRKPVRALSLVCAMVSAAFPSPAPSVAMYAAEEAVGGMGRAEASAESKRDKGQATLYLRDGALLLGRIGTDELQVSTRYGELVIPVEEIVQLRLARRVPEELRRKIEGSILELGEPDFDLREAAMDALRQVGPAARGFLREALRSGDPEVRSRAQSLLAEIPPAAKDSDGDDGLQALGETEDDEIVTRRFVIRGTVGADGFVVSTAYGELRVGREQVVGILFDGERPTTTKVSVAATFAVPQRWCDAKVLLPAGSSVRLTASGQISVPNYSLVSGPEGTRRYSGSTFGSFPMLSLVGKVGRSGAPFLVGRACRVKVPREGKLYLGVVPFRRNYPATGSYEVKVETGR